VWNRLSAQSFYSYSKVKLSFFDLRRKRIEAVLFVHLSIQFVSVSLQQTTQDAFVHFSILGSYFAELEVTKRNQQNFRCGNTNRKAVARLLPIMGEEKESCVAAVCVLIRPFAKGKGSFSSMNFHRAEAQCN
jgi:gluconate kinase